MSGSDLRDACRDNDLQLVKELIEKGVDPTDNDGHPLLMACAFSSLEIVKYLIEKGADINITIEDQNHCVWAIEEDNIEILKYLLSTYPNKFVTPELNMKYMETALEHNSVKCFSYLIYDVKEKQLNKLLENNALVYDQEIAYVIHHKKIQFKLEKL
jgi:ankyrin repeat protein